MEHVVDLDELAAHLAPAVAPWRERATVGPFTWRDERAPWPQPIVTDRASIQVPESLGLRLNLGPDAEMELCIWTGGWADVGYLRDDAVVQLCPEFADVSQAYAAVMDVVEQFLGSPSTWTRLPPAGTGRTSTAPVPWKWNSPRRVAGSPGG